jgi:hypothetical protein
MKILSELVLLLLNTDRLQQFEHFTSSDKNFQIVEGGQYLVEIEQALTKILILLKSVSIW